MMWLDLSYPQLAGSPSQEDANPGKGDGLCGSGHNHLLTGTFLDAGLLWMVLGLAVVAGLVLLILAALGALTVCWKPSNTI